MPANALPKAGTADKVSGDPGDFPLGNIHPPVVGREVMSQLRT
jgi:hypothetical protein